MNRQDIIRMAKEAGLDLDGDNIFSPKGDPQVDVHITDLEALAALVASAEREACAKVCEERGMVKGGEVFASRIRLRGQA